MGVVIGKSGETIKGLQAKSGARIQITRDADHDPQATNRQVEIMGTPDQISRAEQMIKDVIAEVTNCTCYGVFLLHISVIDDGLSLMVCT